VSGIERRRDGKFVDMADGASLGVDYGGPHEGGDARPVIAMLCHSTDRRALLTLPTTRHVSPTFCRSIRHDRFATIGAPRAGYVNAASR
jgi:hypothetical protein